MDGKDKRKLKTEQNRGMIPMGEENQKEKKKSRATFRERISYRFDSIMARGTLAKVLLLLAFSILVIILMGLILFLIGGVREHPQFDSSVWISLMHTFDPGTLGGDDEPRPVLAVLLIVTLFGMFFTATLISIINNGLEERMDRLSKGRSKVLEHDHTIILGFNLITNAIIRQLIEANANQPGRQVIVVMDQSNEKEEMEEAIRRHLSPGFLDLPLDEAEKKTQLRKYRSMIRKTKIVCRKGHLYDSGDLEMCSIETCRSVIVNANDDAHTVKAIMACAAAIDKLAAKRKDPPYITAVIRDKSQMDTAVVAGRNRLEVLCYEEIMSRLIANASRRPGMSYVFTELFNYEDNEIYCVPKSDIRLPEGLNIDQMTIYELNQYLRDCIVIGGISSKNEERSDIEGRILNPWKGMKSCMAPTMEGVKAGCLEKFYVIEEDDDPIRCVSRHNQISTEYAGKGTVSKPHGDLVVLGVGPLVDDILKELDGFLQENSRVTVIDSEERLALLDKKEYSGLSITYTAADLDDFLQLRRVIPKDTESVLILAQESISLEEGEDDQDLMERSDEKILSRLLFVREIRKERGTYFNITCEMNLDQNRKLAEYTDHEDFIVGSSVTAMMITQIAQTRELHRAFHEILDASGSELYMRRAGSILDFRGTKSMDIYTLEALLAQKNEIFIGIRGHVPGIPNDYQIPVINPEKWTTESGRPVLKKYQINEDDMLVVIASE